MTIGRLRMAEIYFQTHSELMKRSACAENIGEAHLESLQAIFDLGLGEGGVAAARMGLVNQNLLKMVADDLEQRSLVAEKCGDSGKEIALVFRNLAQSINDGTYLKKLERK